jgi:hypothetical protein
MKEREGPHALEEREASLGKEARRGVGGIVGAAAGAGDGEIWGRDGAGIGRDPGKRR